jgi:hypothetical protein
MYLEISTNQNNQQTQGRINFFKLLNFSSIVVLKSAHDPIPETTVVNYFFR